MADPLDDIIDITDLQDAQANPAITVTPGPYEGSYYFTFSGEQPELVWVAGVFLDSVRQQFLAAQTEADGAPDGGEAPAFVTGEVVKGEDIDPSLQGYIFVKDTNGVPREIFRPQGVDDTGSVLPPDLRRTLEGVIEPVPDEQLPEGHEWAWDGRRYIARKVPLDMPRTWEEQVTRLLAEGSEDSIAQANEVWSFWNDRMTAPQKLELSFRLAESPGDYITYWALLHGEQPNVGFVPGVRRIPFAELLQQAGLDAGLLTEQALPSEMDQIPEGKARQDKAKEDIARAEEQAQAETEARLKDFTQTQDLRTLPANVGPTTPAEELQSRFPATQVGPTTPAEEFQPERLPVSRSGPQLEQEVLQSRGDIARSGAQVAEGRVTGSERIAARPLPVDVLPDGREVGIAGLDGPEEDILGEFGPEIVIPLRPGAKVGQLVVNQSGNNTPFTQNRPLGNGTFPLRQQSPTPPRLPAFGFSGNQPARPLPALGAPQFPSAQQYSRFLPTERQGFQQQVKLGGFPLEDYLAQLQDQFLNVPRRPQPRFQPSRVSSRV